MNRNFLRWFYVVVQFVMLSVSIPKVATLFHAYSPHPIGPTIGGIDATSWFVGFAIDAVTAVTTMAAMAKYEESRKTRDLIAPAVLVLVCSTLSIVANYEDAAMLRPAQYADVSLFAHPALIVNPILISSPPLLVFLLITLVPSIMAQRRIKSAAEIAAETAQEAAMIEAGAHLKEVRARTSAQVRGARIAGFADNASVIARRAGIALPSAPESSTGAPEGSARASTTAVLDRSVSAIVETSSPTIGRAVWASMPLADRVIKSGVITPQEVAEVLGVTVQHARKITSEVRASDSDAPALPGRKGVAYQALIDALYAHQSAQSFTHAQALEKALGMRKRGKAQATGLHIVTAEDEADVPRASGEE